MEGVFPTPPSVLRISGGELLVSRQAVPLGRPGPHATGRCCDFVNSAVGVGERVAWRAPASGFPGPSCGHGRPCWLRGKRWWRFRLGRCRDRADTAWRVSWGDLQPEACDV